MRVIGVIDVLDGRAVRARGGTRRHYQPVLQVAGRRLSSSTPLDLADAYRDIFGIHEIYLADLDAILDGARVDAAVAQVASSGRTLWVDAGIASPSAACRVRSAGTERVIVGLETLPSFSVLGQVVEAIGSAATAFSLDMRDGHPLVAEGARIRPEPVDAMARRAADTGIGALVVLDLARVGMSSGLDMRLLERIRAAAPALTLVAGGGVRGQDDLRALDAAGCDAALVASALHDGQLAAADCHSSATRYTAR